MFSKMAFREKIRLRKYIALNTVQTFLVRNARLQTKMIIPSFLYVNATVTKSTSVEFYQYIGVPRNW